MRFTCTRFPDGEVPIRTRLGVVVFYDGVAEVEDPELGKALLEVPDLFGISGEAKKAVKKAARPRAKE
jgi:hypothetical protein